MPNNIPTDEERRLFNFALVRLQLHTTVCIILLLAIPIGLMLLFNPPSILSVNISVVIGTIIVSVISYFHVMKRVARRLSLKERQALTHIVETSEPSEKTRTARKLLKIAATLNPANELLRSSVKTEDDTLLRAAAYTDSDPQDQLLRPSENTK